MTTQVFCMFQYSRMSQFVRWTLKLPTTPWCRHYYRYYFLMSCYHNRKNCDQKRRVSLVPSLATNHYPLDHPKALPFAQKRGSDKEC